MTRVLDRIPFFDPRSRQYPIRNLLPGPSEIPFRRRVWHLPAYFPLDQGQEGACVGFGWAGELGCFPVRLDVSDTTARAFYRAAQAEDRSMGNYWNDGASVLGGARAMTALGHVKKYHWAFGIEDVVHALLVKGPVVLGINWYDSMYDTDSNGQVTVGGAVVGGHCILAHGFIPSCAQADGAPAVVWTNSWGTSYGVNGQGYIKVSDLDKLLQANGEACIATDWRK